MKWLFLLLLAVVIFGGAAFFSYDLFVKPERKIQQEKSGEIPVEPVPDVALPDFQAAETAPGRETRRSARRPPEFSPEISERPAHRRSQGPSRAGERRDALHRV